MLGDDHPQTLWAAHEIASCQNYLGRYEEALSGFEAVHAKAHEVLGDDHPVTKQTVDELAKLHTTLSSLSKPN